MEAVFADIMKVLEGAVAQSAMVAVVIEFVLRMIPSAKPLGIAYIIADVAKAVGGIFMKVGELLDKVLPQKIKPPVE
jgi:ERCC4-type nuclease